MNRTSKLIFRSNSRVLIKPQETDVIYEYLQPIDEGDSQGICKKKLYDKIGPADPISNLHHVKYAIQENETATEKELRKYREDLQEWNELFWTKHNLKFIEKKKEFQENELKKKNVTNKKLSADDMSIFYKDFLDKNWKTHLTYLLEWYRRHAFATFLHFRVEIEKVFKKS